MAIKGSFNFHGVVLPRAYARIQNISGSAQSRQWQGSIVVYPDSDLVDAIKAARTAYEAVTEGEVALGESSTAWKAKVIERQQAVTDKTAALEQATAQRTTAEAAAAEEGADAEAVETLRLKTNAELQARTALTIATSELENAEAQVAASLAFQRDQAVNQAVADVDAAQRALVPITEAFTVTADYEAGVDPYALLYPALKAQATFSGMLDA